MTRLPKVGDMMTVTEEDYDKFLSIYGDDLEVVPWAGQNITATQYVNKANELIACKLVYMHTQRSAEYSMDKRAHASLKDRGDDPNDD